jgi:hypothetical protein
VTVTDPLLHELIDADEWAVQECRVRAMVSDDDDEREEWLESAGH